MTKKILLLLSVGVLFCFTTQAQNKKAAAYNNKIIDIQYKLVPDVVNFFKAIEGGELSALKSKRDILMKDFDKAIVKVSKMQAFEGDDELRKAALDWFKLYESSLNDEYNLLMEIASKPKDKRTENDKVQLKVLSDDLIAQEEAIDERFQAAQQAFSKKHDLELKQYAIGQTK